MTDNFKGTGRKAVITAAGTLTSGDVIAMGNTIGIVAADAVSGDSVTIELDGEHTVPKVSAAVFVVGEALIWDTSVSKFDDSAATPATGDITGAVIALKPGANAETTCRVLLTPGNTTIT